MVLQKHASLCWGIGMKDPISSIMSYLRMPLFTFHAHVPLASGFSDFCLAVVGSLNPEPEERALGCLKRLTTQ